MPRFRISFIPVFCAFGPIALAFLLAGAAKAQSSSGTVTINAPDSFSVTRYVVQGVVKDDNDAPVEGAVLHIGRGVAYTNSSGRFLVRFSKRGVLPFSIAKDTFINNRVYAVISAPSQVQAESEEDAADVQIVVRRIPASQARLYPQ